MAFTPSATASRRNVRSQPRLSGLRNLLCVAFEAWGRCHVRVGDLEIDLPGQAVLQLGDGSGPRLALTLRDWSTVARIVLDPSMNIGDAYVSGDLALRHGTVRDLADLMGRNAALRGPAKYSVVQSLRGWMTSAGRAACRARIAHHYDLDLDLFARFLDPELQYSCAVFVSDDSTLEDAQIAKMDRIARKLCLRPDLRILDIGSAWGGLGLRLAERHGAKVEGVTLSVEQHREATHRAAVRHLSDRVHFSVTDYRDTVGPFDRIVSVGMLEHVGRKAIADYFKVVAARLTSDGAALVHSIVRPDGPAPTQPWIQRHIFPGGYIPALSEIVTAAERAGLLVTDVEILRLHYAETLRHWQNRFQAGRSEVAETKGESFCRMWEFYLAVSEAAFRHRNHFVAQIQLARRIDSLPTVRDYMTPP